MENYWGERHLETGLAILRQIAAGKGGSWRKGLRHLARAAKYYDAIAAQTGSESEAASTAQDIRAHSRRQAKAFMSRGPAPI